MIAIRAILDKRVFYLLSDFPVMSSRGMRAEGGLIALDITPATHEAVIAPQPEFWVGGGVLAYDDGWSVVDQPAYDAAVLAAYKASIPTVVDMSQARLALLGAGLLDTADTAIAAMPGADGAAARIEWEYRTVVRRDSPLVVAMSSLLGLDDNALDQLFLQASTL